MYSNIDISFSIRPQFTVYLQLHYSQFLIPYLILFNCFYIE